MSLMAFHAVNKKISLHIGNTKYIGAFKLTRSKTIEDRLPEVDFISPLDKIPTENEYKFWFGAHRNKYEKNPYLLVRINIDPLDVMYISIYYPDNPILTNLLESIKKNSLDDYWRT